MIKVFTPESFGFDDAIAVMVKRSSRGIIGNDFSELVKRAGFQFAEQIKHAAWEPGDIPVHIIALSCTETGGPNRNSDGFRRDVCRKYHDTFVKHARVYRDHNNKIKSKSYGLVTHSAFNEKMGRIELLAVLNGTKQAADRNGGLLADKELEKLAADQPIMSSMSCWVSHDSCSGCHNKAKSRDEYCLGVDEGGSCERGGLKHNMNKVSSDGHILHADNPDPKFFDISHVGRRADRTAYVTGQLAKAASTEAVISGAEWAERLGVQAPSSLLPVSDNPVTARRVKLAYELAAIEERLAVAENTNVLGLAVKSASVGSFTANLNARETCMALDAARDLRMPVTISDYLTAHGAPANQLHTIITKVAEALPGIYGRMTGDLSVEQAVETTDEQLASPVSEHRIISLVMKSAADYSIAEPQVRQRVAKQALQSTNGRAATILRTEKTSDAIEPGAERLARKYAAYRLACLDHWRHDPYAEQMKELVVRQHYLT